MARMPWVSLQGCTCGGPYLGRVAGLWAGLLVLAWLVIRPLITGPTLSLKLRLIWLRHAGGALSVVRLVQTLSHGPLPCPFAVAEGYRIQNSAF